MAPRGSTAVRLQRIGPDVLPKRIAPLDWLRYRPVICGQAGGAVDQRANTPTADAGWPTPGNTISCHITPKPRNPPGAPLALTQQPRRVPSHARAIETENGGQLASRGLGGSSLGLSKLVARRMQQAPRARPLRRFVKHNSGPSRANMRHRMDKNGIYRAAAHRPMRSQYSISRVIHADVITAPARPPVGSLA